VGPKRSRTPEKRATQGKNHNALPPEKPLRECYLRSRAGEKCKSGVVSGLGIRPKEQREGLLRKGGKKYFLA